MPVAWKLRAPALLLPVIALALGALPARGQTFLKVADPGNAAATNSAALSSYVGVSWVDYDGDGDDDLFISITGLFRNDGGGLFTLVPNAVSLQGTAIGNTWADVDNDGDLDVWVSGGKITTPLGPGRGSALYLNHAGAFTKVTTGAVGDTLGNAAWGCAFGDYDRDGFVDLVTAAASGFAGINVPNRLFHNLGGGAFARVDTAAMCLTLAPYTNATWSDYDGDGDPDLFIAAGPATGALARDYLYTNRAESAPNWFTRIGTSALGTDTQDGQMYAWIDYDNDGDLDVYLTNYSGSAPNRLYRNDGGGNFTRMSGIGPIVTDNFLSLSSVWEDFDNDGDLDCLVTNDGTQSTLFYRNNGGTFTSIFHADLTVAGPRYGASASDYDQDGDMDLYLAGANGKYGLFRNTTSNGNAWFEVSLVGTVSNRAAIGAKVRVKATIGGVPVWQMRELSAQSTFGGMNSLTAHFGLGDATSVDSLVVEWPSGIVTRQASPAIRSRVTLVENPATAVLVALASASWESGAVRLHWVLNGVEASSATIERSAGGNAWSAIGRTTVAAGEVELVDADVVAGTRYGYRLRVRDGVVDRTVGEVWTDAVASASARIQRLSPNPSNGPLQVRFAIARGAVATLELFDLNGRLLETQRVEAAGSGVVTRELGAARVLPAGVYLVRLSQGGRSDTARAVVVR